MLCEFGQLGDKHFMFLPKLLLNNWECELLLHTVLTNIYRKIGGTFALVLRTLWHLSNIISPYPTWHLKPDPNKDGCSRSILLLSELTVKAEASYWIWRCRGQRSADWWALCPGSPPRSSRRCAPRHTASRAWCPSAIHWSSSAARWNIPEHPHKLYISNNATGSWNLLGLIWAQYLTGLSFGQALAFLYKCHLYLNKIYMCTVT